MFLHRCLGRFQNVTYKGRRCLSVIVNTDNEGSKSTFRQRVKVGKHTFLADEPEGLGGENAGPSPYDLLLSSLGACTSMTLRMYASRKKIPLEGVEVHLEHDKVYAKDCEECSDELKGKNTKIDKFERVITLFGDELSEAERTSLLRIANMCPVHKTLEAGSIVKTTLLEKHPGVIMTQDLIIPGRISTLPGDFRVTRLLPYSKKRLVGPFCFFDHMGPKDLSTGSLDVGPHPHIGLSTLTYLFNGALVHRDSTGAEATILPGDANLMISGKGAVHSERGDEAIAKIPGDKKILHGLQLWIALPKDQESCNPSFHHADSTALPDISKLLSSEGDVSGTLVCGSLLGASVSSLPMTSPMFFADVQAKAGSTVEFSVEVGHEICLYVVSGEVRAGAEKSVLHPTEGVVYTSREGSDRIRFSALEEDARVVVFGGRPFPEERHITWNFVSSDKSFIKSAIDDWKNALNSEDKVSRARFPKVHAEANLDSIPMPGRFH